MTRWVSLGRVGLVTAAALLLSGCVPTPAPPPRTSTQQPSTDQIAQAALTTGHFSLPAGATVTAADVETGIDRLYRVSLDVPAGEVDAMLAAADFTALKPGAATMDPLPGAPTPNPPTTSSGQDRISSDQGGVWYRVVEVDRADPTVARVRLWIFTT